MTLRANRSTRCGPLHRFFGWPVWLVVAFEWAFSLVVAASEPVVARSWRAGVARVEITPEKPLWMAGYAARQRPAEGTLQPLYAKALALEDPQGYRLVLVTTDLIGMRSRFTERVFQRIASQFELSRPQVLFTSSHTHCGPLLADGLDGSVWYVLTPEQEQDVRQYTQWLAQRLEEVMAAAIHDLQPAELAWGVGTAQFAMNRRQVTPRGIVIGFNPDGPVDWDVPVLRVTSRDGKLRAVVFGYACHNTTLNIYQWCGDYAGYAQQYLEESHPGAVALFFMGCGADANPAPRQTVELCQQHGRHLADAVESVLGDELRVVEGRAAAAFAEIDLGLDKLPTRDELLEQAQGEPGYLQRRAVKLLKVLDEQGRFSPTYSYPIQAWQIGSSLTWLSLGGEAVVDYSLQLKSELGPGLWVAAYANDVAAYIPSRRVLQEGGYEATITSGQLAGRQFAADTQDRIFHAARRLVAEVRGTVQPTQKRLRIAVVGAHPDDPESGCGGLIARLTDLGHEVLVAYTTCFRGNRRIGDEPEADVRRREATAACQILKARPRFFDYAHEKLYADADTIRTVGNWLQHVQPDIVITHWPLDTHPNHHVTGSIVWQLALQQRQWNVYFFEVMSNRQTKLFLPDTYVDITSVWHLKNQACQCHQSQNPSSFWDVHEEMHRQRGKEAGVDRAEAYLLYEVRPGLARLPEAVVHSKR